MWKVSVCFSFMAAASESEEPKRFGLLWKHNLFLLLCLLPGKYSVIYLQLATEVQEVVVVSMLCNVKKTTEPCKE